jgi:hypothetical protein
MRDTLSKLREHWAVGRAIPMGGASEQEIQAFQNTYEIQMPEDLHRYFKEVNGMRPDWRYDQDSIGFTFWTLSRVQPLSVVTPRGSVDWSDSKLNSNEVQYFVFADYLGESWWYAVGLPKRNAYAPVVIISHPNELVAHSFSEFFDLYFVDSPKLYPSRGCRQT